MSQRSATEIRAEIEATREELEHRLALLQTSVTKATDWRGYVRRQPLAFVGGAFALGLIIGFR